MPVYRYEPVDKSHIRLLDLQPASQGAHLACNIRTVSASSGESYEALSYCWGLEGQSKAITCNDATIEVSTNLASALERLRLNDRPRTLWIDQICINQRDVGEKNIQVPLMSSIYSQAEKVLIWIGEEDENTGLMVSWMQSLITESITLHQNSGDVAVGPDILGTATPFDAKECVAYRKFVTAPWFHRCWVFQELIVSREAAFMIGSFSIPWGTVIISHHMLCQIDKHLPVHQSYSIPNRGYIDGLCLGNTLVKMGRTVEQSSPSGPFETLNETLNLLALVILLLKNQTTDPRDKIYGVLGVANDLEQGYPGIDYTASLQTVYGRYTQWFINRYEDLSVLKYVNISPPSGQKSSCRVLPAWVPDYSIYDWHNNIRLHQGPNYPQHGLRRIYNATGLSRIRCSEANPLILALQGICIGRIIAISDSAGTFQGEVAIRQEILTGGQWSQLAASCAIDGLYQHTGESITLAYARLRIVDILPGETDAAARRARARLTSIPEPSDTSCFTEKGQPLRLPQDRMSRQIVFATTRQRLYLTDTGYLGLCHHSCVIGDQVYLLMGGDMPFVLRDMRNTIGSFHFKGETYVHGVMDGEHLLKYRTYGENSQTDEEWLGSIGDGSDKPWPFQTETVLLA